MLDSMRWRYRLSEARAFLQAERDLLVKGRAAELDGLAARRRLVAESLAEMPASVAEANQTAVREIAAAARRNQRLLRAWLDGAAEAVRRLKAIDESRARIGAYRPDGSRLAGAAATPTTERRA